MKKVIDVATETITFSFDGLEPVHMHAKWAKADNQTYAMLHGFAARIGDNAAIPKSEENGFKVTEEMRRNAVIELVEHYHGDSTEWNIKSGPRAVKQNATILALATKAGITYAEMEAKLADMDVASLMG